MANEQIRPRDAVESRYKWHLEDIYPDFAAWEADFERAKTAVADMKAAQSALKPGRDEILAVLLHVKLGFLNELYAERLQIARRYL